MRVEEAKGSRGRVRMIDKKAGRVSCWERRRHEVEKEDV